MKFGVVIFPGSNCDHDTLHVINNVLGEEAVPLWHKDRDLKNCDWVVMPGGFAHGDYLRAGAVARFSPVMEEVIDFANKGGKVLGICNGFQVLCESHLLPGALVKNLNQKFICKNLHISPVTHDSPLTHTLEQHQVLKTPVAHAEGRYFAHQETLTQLNDEDRVLFRYTNEDGKITNESNPNGSVEAIAGICNKNRNVFGLMPHPERAAEEVLGNTDGRLILEGLLEKVPQ